MSLASKLLLPFVIALFIVVSATGVVWYRYYSANRPQNTDQPLMKVPQQSTQSAANHFTASNSSPLDLSKYRNVVSDGEIYFLKKDKIYELETSTMGSHELSLNNVASPEFLSTCNTGRFLFLGGFWPGDRT